MYQVERDFNNLPEYFITKKGEGVILNLTLGSIRRLVRKYDGNITMAELIVREIEESRKDQRN